MIQHKTTMNKISITYSLIWQFKSHPHYQFTKCRKCFNVMRGTQVKSVLNGGSVGFWIAGNFYPKSKLNQNLELISKAKKEKKMTQATFDFTGEQLKRAGMALAQEHADAVTPGWSELAYQFLVNQFLPLHKRFMAEDVRSYAAQVDFTLPPHARAWGGVIAKAAKEYLIIKTSIRPVKNPKAHCANAALWERNDERLIELNIFN